ncbi:translocation/assembly module TamB domain-containing protein [Marinimicrobium sp. ARAG 43.8]|uniref:translocation/assembly module TamB domain-containing protein n=1 Tax=Marinimicrobium sp. ARAG 43.8 TaxID=3418719 RepID=UPI003CEC2E07
MSRSYTVWIWRLLKALKIAVLSLLALVILILALVSAIVATEPGSRWALNQAAQRLPLTFEGMSGNLITGMDLDWVEYHLEDQHYRVEGLSFRWQPLALLYSAVSVQSLRATAVELHLPPPSDEPEPDTNEPRVWPSLALPIRIELGGVDLRGIRVIREGTETALNRVSGTLSLGTFNLRVWDLTVVAPAFEVEVDGRTGLRYPYDSNLAVRWHYTLEDLGGQPMTFRGDADINGDLTSITANHRLTAPATLTSDIRFWPNLDDDQNEPQVLFDTSWPSQILPPALFPQDWPTVETGGRLVLDGWMSDYHLDVSITGQAQGFPRLDVTGKGRGSMEALQLESLAVQLPRGAVTASGDVAWAPEPRWDLAVNLEAINPAELPVPALAGWPGDIGGGLKTQGAMAAQGLQASVSELNIAGHLRAMALLLRGNAAYDADGVEASELHLALGANQLRLDGNLSDQQMAITGDLKAPILSQLDPRLAGSLEADFALSGSPSEPEGRVRLTASDAAFEAYQLKHLALMLERTGSAYQVSLASQGLELPGVKINEAGLSGQGDVEAHQLSFSASTATWGELSLSLAGGYREASWEGEMTALRLSPPDPLVWELESPAPLVLSAEELVLRSLCLSPWARWQLRDGQRPDRPADGRICLDGQWQPQGGGSAVAQIQGLPLRLAQRWLQDTVTLEGTLEGRLEALLPAQGDANASLHLSTRDGALRYQFGEEDAEVFQWEATELTASWQGQNVQADLLSDWGDVGRVQANVGMVLDTQSLSGEIHAELDSLQPVEALVPQVREVGGVLNADLTLAGTVPQPEVSGQVTLREGTAKLPEFGLHLEALTFEAQARPEHVDLSAAVTSGDGTLQLEGAIDKPWQLDREIQASVSGENFQALNTRELLVLLSPDLNLTMTPQRIDLTGNAVIPKALARFKTLPESATRTSDDVVLKESDEDGTLRGASLYMDLNLSLGDDVRFEGFGLQSRLSGELQVIQNPERGLLTIGEVGVAEGRYKAYGQDLTIERGRLIFQGPYDNPGLDIRATRTADEITAGLEITGTLQRPRSRVFSTPSLPDSEAMAILLTGKPLSRSSSADASMLVNAIGSLGLERSGFITAEIADTFSLDEFRIQAEDNVTESSLYIGKYLTPKLFVRYVVGLFDQTNSVGLRYELTEELRLEAESGLQQSVDMIYKFER